MLLITGTPRSGTGFMSKLFTYAGMPCGHEQQYGGQGRTSVFAPVAESSWMAAPYINRHEKVIHIVRNPLKVVNSMTQCLSLYDEKARHYRFIRKWLPEFLNYEGLDRYMYFYVEWNNMIERLIIDRYRLEDINKDKAGFLKQFISPKKIYQNENYNSFDDGLTKNPELKIGDIPDSTIKQLFIDKIKQYKYAVL